MYFSPKNRNRDKTSTSMIHLNTISLYSILYQGIQMAYCLRCGALFMDYQNYNELTVPLHVTSADITGITLEEHFHIPRYDTENYLCPDCLTFLLRKALSTEEQHQPSQQRTHLEKDDTNTRTIYDKPEDFLRLRYVLGEIDETEFDTLKRELTHHRHDI